MFSQTPNMYIPIRIASAFSQDILCTELKELTNLLVMATFVTHARMLSQSFPYKCQCSRSNVKVLKPSTQQQSKLIIILIKLIKIN
jgi:hypothetical protein